MHGFLNFSKHYWRRHSSIEICITKYRGMQKSTKNPSMPAYCQFRYWIGSGTDGLDKALPSEKSAAKPLLHKFEGRQNNTMAAVIRAGSECAFRAILKNQRGSTAGSQERLIKFNVAIAYDNRIMLHRGGFSWTKWRTKWPVKPISYPLKYLSYHKTWNS